MLLGSVLLAGLVFQGTRVEAWPSGAKKAEYQTAFDEQGQAEKHGPFRSFHENGQLESEGSYEHGKETGPWVYLHANGVQAASGSYDEALKNGPWKSFYPDGKPESEGSYLRGARDGRWSFWDPEGKKDLAASGIHKLVVYREKDDNRYYRGYLVDNLREGQWTSYWPDKTVQLEGSFSGGKREGSWLFRHPDGTYSSLLFTGSYAAGAWVGASPVPEPPPFDPAHFPVIEPAPTGWPARREELALLLRSALKQRVVAPELRTVLEVAGVPAIPLVLELVRGLDPENAEDRAALGFLEHQLLRPLCAGHALARHGLAGPSDAPAARELVRAWLSLWALTRTDLVFWQVDVPGPSRGVAGLRDVLQDPPIFELDRHHAPEAGSAPDPKSESTSSALHPAYRLRFGKAKDDKLRYAPAGTKESIARALRWLVAHQQPDGGWDNDEFMTQCGKLGKDRCGGPGSPTHDVGVTALALLAFLGDGHTPQQGTHRELVTRGLDWLVRHQASEGLIGERQSHDFLYDHLIATAALCEGVGLGGEALRAPAERAVAVLQSARNPTAGWRYDLPPAGENDTSVTGWAVQALLAARYAGLAVDEAAFAGALNFLDKVSDPESGRIGYSGFNELSARTPANENYPREKGEAMTGVGLLCRLQLGQDPTHTPILVQHARLIASKPPLLEELGNDQYYWYYGTCALHEYGAPFWDTWLVELRRAVILPQVKRGDAEGSWDPVGPWGYMTGRVGSTALMALALECFYRFPRALDGAK